MDEKLLKTIQNLYRFQGVIRFVKVVDQGYLSHNVVLEDDEKRYFLKRYRFDNENRVIETHNAKSFFFERGIPVVMPILSVQEKSFFRYEENFYVLFPFISGFQSTDKNLTDEALRSMGRLLANIHLVGKDSGSLTVESRAFSLDKAYFSKRVSVLRSIIDRQEEKTEYDTLAVQCLDLKTLLVCMYSEQYEDLLLLQGKDHILHGDFHDENVFFDADGNVMHVFDWEKVNRGPRGLDVARSLPLICFWDGFSDAHFHNAGIYLRAYNEMYPMDKEYLRESLMFWNREQAHALWILESHYLRHDHKAGSLLESHMKRLRYWSVHEDEYVERLANMLE